MSSRMTRFSRPLFSSGFFASGFFGSGFLGSTGGTGWASMRAMSARSLRIVSSSDAGA